MAYLVDGYYGENVVARAIPSERAAFIQRTYTHLAGAVLLFIGIEAALFQTNLNITILNALGGPGRAAGLILMVAFIGAGYVARWWANSATSKPLQYAGLGLYVLVEAIIMLQILTFATNFFPGQYLVEKAGLATLALFGGLTMTVFISGKDFSFLGSFLCIAGWIALAVAFGAFLFGFDLGLIFSSFMILLAGGYILYNTSNVMNHYRTDQHVAAALELFASVALLFFYILRVLMELQGRRN